MRASQGSNVCIVQLSSSSVPLLTMNKRRHKPGMCTDTCSWGFGAGAAPSEESSSTRSATSAASLSSLSSALQQHQRCAFGSSQVATAFKSPLRTFPISRALSFYVCSIALIAVVCPAAAPEMLVSLLCSSFSRHRHALPDLQVLLLAQQCWRVTAAAAAAANVTR